MGPYQYETIYLSIGLFGMAKDGAAKIQNKIDEYVEKGWELFEFHPIQTAFAWKWNILIFRKPAN